MFTPEWLPYEQLTPVLLALAYDFSRSFDFKRTYSKHVLTVETRVILHDTKMNPLISDCKNHYLSLIPFKFNVFELK